MHRAVPLQVNHPENPESKPFLLTIQKIQGFKRPTNNTQLSFTITGNLFYLGQTERQFFGRTYESPRINIDFQADGINYDHQAITIYYHTKITQNRETQLLVILELQLYEAQESLVIKRYPVGWSEILALQITNQAQKLQLRKGSPRVLLLQSSFNFDTLPITMFADISLSQPFQNCYHLIPENTLCGFGDEVPGLKKGFIIDDFDLQKTTTAFLSNVQVLVPENIDLEIQKQVLKYRAYKYRMPEDSKQDVRIVNRKLVIAFHNGWTFVNARGEQNYVPLGDTRMVITENVEGKSYQFKILQYQGVLDVNNISVSDQNNNPGLLIALLQYDVTYTTNAVNKYNMTLVVGWIPIFINNKLGGEEIIDEDFITGPGKAASGQPLVQLPEYPLKLRGTLNLQGQFQMQELINKESNRSDQVQRPQQQQLNQMSMQRQSFQMQGQLQGQMQGQMQGQIHGQMQGQMQGQMPQQFQQQLDTDIRTQVKLKELEAQLYRMQEENERLRRLHIQSRQDEIKQQELFKTIEQLREENRMVMFTQSKQYEGLERMIKDTKQAALSTSKSGRHPIIESESYPDHVQIKNIDSYGYPIPIATLKPIPKLDFYNQTLIDFEEIDVKEDRILQIENDDERKDSIFLITPKALIQYPFDQQPSKSVYFTFHFYDLPVYQTPMLKLEFHNDDRDFKFNIENGNPLRVLINNEEYNFKFEINTSSNRYYNLHLDLAKYLYQKHMIVDIWDSDSMLLFGSAKIPLSGLLRQGKQSASMMNEFEIIDMAKQQIRGKLQINIRNIGKIGQKSDIMDATIINKSLNNLDKAEGVPKKKIIVEKPINREIVPEHKEINEQNRIKERINKLKQQNLQQFAKSTKKSEQLRTVYEVQKFKESQKPSLLKTILQGFIQNEKILNVFSGKSEVIPYYYKNTLSTQTQVNIIIEDPDSSYLTYQEFLAVSNPLEWQYWVKKRNYPEPHSYEIVKMREINKKAQFFMMLEPGEEVTFLLKFLSFRIIDTKIVGEANAEDIALTRGKDYIEKYMNNRYITVCLQNIDGKIIDGIRVQIQPHQLPTDHVLRFFERDNRQVRLNLPPLFQQEQQNKPTLHVSDHKVMVEWSTDNNYIRLNLKVGDVCTIQRFSVIAYKDQYQNSIYGHWKVEVHALNGVDLEVPLGQKVAARLTLPSDVQRNVNIIPANNRVIQFDKTFAQNLPLLPGKINLIPFQVRTIKEGKQSIQVNCVDYNAQELIHAWLLNINSIAQQPSAVYEIRCMEGREFRQQVSYKNQTSYLAQFQITSSSEFVKLVDPIISCGPYETVNFKIRVLPTQDMDVKLFLNDTEERIFDTLLLKIKYVE